MIDVKDWKQHTKLCLLDKKSYAEQKAWREQREAKLSLADGDEIAKNLKKFAQARPELYQDIEKPIEV